MAASRLLLGFLLASSNANPTLNFGHVRRPGPRPSQIKYVFLNIEVTFQGPISVKAYKHLFQVGATTGSSSPFFPLGRSGWGELSHTDKEPAYPSGISHINLFLVNIMYMIAVLRLLLGAGSHLVSLRSNQDCSQSCLAGYQYCSPGSV